MVGPLLSHSSLHSSRERQSAPSEVSIQQPLPIPFPEKASEASEVSLKERITSLGSTRDVIPSVVQSNKSALTSVLPIVLVGEACHDLGLEKLKGKEGQARYVDDISEENRMQNLLLEAQEKGIIISRDFGGQAKITQVMNYSEEEQWECLKKIHGLVPIVHLTCERSENVEALFLFLQSTEGLVFLDLGKSPNMTDGQLEKLSQHLPALKSFSIASALVTHIPPFICNRVETLRCAACLALVAINAPIAMTVTCKGCTALTILNAPAAVTVLCSRCKALTTLIAPRALGIYCWGCTALTILSAPAAREIGCDNCSALTTLYAPLAKTVVCAFTALTFLNAPTATRVDCKYCKDLATIDAPVATTIQCDACTALTALNAPAVTMVDCQYCKVLATLDVPAATTIRCGGCKALATLDVPVAATVQCNGCTALTALNAPTATEIGGWQDTALASKARLKLLTHLRRNITIMACYSEGGQNFSKLMKRAGGTQERPLNRWLADIGSFAPPTHVESAAEENDSKQKIADFLRKLIELAEAEGIVKEQSLEWFKALKNLDSLQQRKKRVIWLGALLMCSAPGKKPFADRNAMSTLMAIGNLENPFLQQKLTHALLSMYDEGASNPEDVWKQTAKLNEHQILPHLLFSRAKFKKESAEGLLKTLEPRYYQNTAVLTPILEMTCMLSSLPSVQQEKLLTLIFKVPQKEKGEKKGKFNTRVAEQRKKQSTLITACRDLLFFGRGGALRHVKNEGDLLEKHKTICQEIFGIREEFVPQFSISLTSKRHFNALLTYAARLQTLPMDEIDLLTGLLGRFANACLDGSFPDNRYDLSVNPHLSLIFKDNPALLKKWVSPLEIDLAGSEKLQESSSIDAYEIFKRLMMNAIAGGHLGENQDARYRTLTGLLKTKNFEAIPASLEKLQAEFNRLGEAGERDKQKDLVLEMDCLKALDPNTAQEARIGIVTSLLKKIPSTLEFKHDVKGLLQALNPKVASWKKIESTDNWEDLLLMGTEVGNSCQRIDGDPSLNKCLLAYILDGKNKAIIVRDAEGRIAARSVLRILWSQKQMKPVLFMERVYTSTGDPILPDLVRRGCEQKAKEMGLALAVSPQGFSLALSDGGVLSALGGPAPFEYVDALNGIQKEGWFEIRNSRILYMAKTD